MKRCVAAEYNMPKKTNRTKLDFKIQLCYIDRTADIITRL